MEAIDFLSSSSFFRGNNTKEHKISKRFSVYFGSEEKNSSSIVCHSVEAENLIN